MRPRHHSSKTSAYYTITRRTPIHPSKPTTSFAPARRQIPSKTNGIMSSSNLNIGGHLRSTLGGRFSRSQADVRGHQARGHQTDYDQQPPTGEPTPTHTSNPFGGGGGAKRSSRPWTANHYHASSSTSQAHGPTRTRIGTNTTSIKPRTVTNPSTPNKYFLGGGAPREEIQVVGTKPLGTTRRGRR